MESGSSEFSVQPRWFWRSGSSEHLLGLIYSRATVKGLNVCVPSPFPNSHAEI